MVQTFAGQVALVAGASRGIGAAIAEALAAQGAHVVLAARSTADLEAVEERIHAAGGAATIAPLDLATGDGIARLAQAMAERWPALDLLVLNAAMLGTLGPAAQIDGSEFNRLLTLNVLVPQALIAAFDPLLRQSAAGRVIGITSGVGAKPRAYWGAYGASKAALDTLLQAYAQEVGNVTSIKVAIVDPGATATAMRALAYPGEDPATLKPPAEVAEAVVDLLTSDFDSGCRLEVGA